jgi:RNA polymerase sigma factor (sigma-70 family)
MMNMILMESATASDEQLWRLACNGDREAFSRIVERYQSLICSLAYSACGALGTSEDMAQETFITAWHQLTDLHEPSKLRQWLCGIVRNIAANAVRRDLRRGGAPESLEVVAEEASPEDDPAAQAVTREEETLLWRTLSELPNSYREPLVLFYREERSVSEVARQLDLNEDTVKQRLSRGRAMLREEMAALVESTLTRSRPTYAFTATVLAVLPAIAPTGASAAVLAGAAAGKGAGAAKGLLASLGQAAIIGPAIGLFIAVFSTRAAASTGRSAEERTSIRRYALRIVIFCWLMSIGLAAALVLAGKLYQAGTLQTLSPIWIVSGVLVWVAALVGTIMWYSTRMQREVSCIRAATGTDDEAYGEVLAAKGLKLSGPLLYESNLRLLGIPLLAVACGGNDPGSFKTRRAVGWIAFGDFALSPFLAMGGFAIGPVAFGGITLGLISLSLWGVGVGVLAFGSAAVGWWAFGLGAIGGEAAAGGAAWARNYAIGAIARAAEANTPAAKAWFAAEWFSAPMQWFAYNLHWLVLAIVLTAVGRLLYRNRKLHRRSR